MNFHSWLLTAWMNLLSWFGVEEQKLASFLYPVFKDAKDIVVKDLMADIIGGLPIVAAALSGGIPAALIAAEQYVLPILEKQGLQLAQTTLNIIYNALVAQAQESVKMAEPPAPVA